MKQNKLLGIILLTQAAIWGIMAGFNFHDYAKMKKEYLEKPMIQIDNRNRNLGIIDLGIVALDVGVAGLYFGLAKKKKEEKQYVSD
jgi:hypothetical protein